MLRVDSLDLGLHVVIGVGRLNVQQNGFIRQLHFATRTQHQVQSSFLLDVVVRLCPVIVNSICIPHSCIFLIAKTGLLRCCLFRVGSLHEHPGGFTKESTTYFVKGPVCRWNVQRMQSESSEYVRKTTGFFTNSWRI